MTKKALITTTKATAIDCTHIERVTGIKITSAEPLNTLTRFVTRIKGGNWQAFKNGAWSDVDTQDLTAESVITEGNSKTELTALSETELSAFAGKEIDVAVAMQVASGADYPSVSKFEIAGSNSQIKKDYFYSDVIKLSDNAVGIIDIDAVQTANSGGAVNVYASTRNDAGQWSNYVSYENASNSANAIRFKAEVEIDRPGISIAQLESITIQHLTSSKSGSVEGKSVLVTKPITLADEVSRAHALIRHPVAEDTEFKMSIVFGTSDSFIEMTRISTREKNGIVEEDYEYIVTDDTKSNTVMLKVEIDQQQGTVTGEVLGTGTGRQQVYKLPHNARVETIEVTGSTSWTYKEKTKTLFVTAESGNEVSISYDWIAKTSYLTALACVFNQ